MIEFEPFIGILFIFAGIAILWIAKHMFYSFAAPVGIFGALWCFSLALFYLGFSKFYTLEIGTIIVFLITIGLFILGAISAIGVLSQKRSSPFLFQKDKFIESSRSHQVVYVVFVIGVLGAIVYYYRLHQLLGIESLWTDPMEIRIEESVGILRHPGWVGLARSLLIPCFVLAIMSLNLPHHKSKKCIMIVAVVSFSLMLPSSGRTTIGTMIIWAVIATIYLRECIGKYISIKQYVTWILVLAGLLILYFFATTNMLQKGVDGEAGVADIGVYTVSSFTAFQEMIKSPEQFATKSSLTFGMVSRVLYEIDPDTFSYPENVQPSVYIPIFTNVYTYLDVYFIDFGWIGVVVFPYVMGLLTTLVYFSMRKTPSIVKVYIASLLGLCIFQSTGVNRFGNFLIWVWILVPIITGSIINIIAPRR